MLLIFNFLYIMFVFLFLCIYTNPATGCYMNKTILHMGTRSLVAHNTHSLLKAYIFTLKRYSQHTSVDTNLIRQRSAPASSFFTEHRSERIIRLTTLDSRLVDTQKLCRTHCITIQPVCARRMPDINSQSPTSVHR